MDADAGNGALTAFGLTFASMTRLSGSSLSESARTAITTDLRESTRATASNIL